MSRAEAGFGHSRGARRGLTVGSLFSGIGGLDLGLERAGHRVLWQVEYDKQARSVLQRHWPAVTIHEDVCHVGGPTLAAVDLVCGGFPCQDVSVAGRRAGLDGERSGLWFEFHRIVRELLPTWVLVENVPGLRSSEGGRDLAAILRGLAELGYVGAWRSLDSQYFGVAQRRERIFLLACRDPRAGCPGEVLALAEGLSGHPAPSRETGARVAASLTRGADSQGKGGYAGRRQEDDYNVVAHSLRAEGFDAGEDGTGRGTPIVVSETGRGWWSEGVSALRADPGGMPAHIAFNATQDPISSEDFMGALSDQGAAVLAFDASQVTSPKNWSNPKPGDPCHPLNTDSRAMVTATIPRRLTPRECERLQGFPDDWTRSADTGREIADGPRYRMLGNAVTVNVAEWIGHRLAASLEKPAVRRALEREPSAGGRP